MKHNLFTGSGRDVSIFEGAAVLPTTVSVAGRAEPWGPVVLPRKDLRAGVAPRARALSPLGVVKPLPLPQASFQTP